MISKDPMAYPKIKERIKYLVISGKTKLILFYLFN